MTTIVAVRNESVIAVATDSRWATGWSETYPTDNFVGDKMLRVSDAVVGIVGVGKFLDVVRAHKRENPDVRLSCREDVFDYGHAVADFAKERYGLEPKRTEDSAPFQHANGALIVACPAGIFVLHDDLSISEYRKYTAAGSGHQYARGALTALTAGKKRIQDPRKLALAAVKAAAQHDLGTASPFRTRVVGLRR